MRAIIDHSLFPFLLIVLPFIVLPLSGIEQALPAAVFSAVVLLWLTEALPLPVTGLLVPVLAILTGTLSVERAFGAFGNQILFLFMGSFFLARSMEKHGFDVRLSYFILSSQIGSRSISALIALVASIAWLFSMWISNTATVAMMAPLCLGISATLKDSFSSDQEVQRFNARLLLSLAFAASAGGMATPVGSPPNLLAIEFLSNKGIEVTFLKWMAIALPLSFVMLFCILAILRLLFNTEEVSLDEVRLTFKRKLSKLGKLTNAERMTAFCFFLAVILWIVPDLLIQFADMKSLVPLKERLPMGLVAILAGALLFFLPAHTSNKSNQKVLNWTDGVQIDWGTIMLFGGGLCLGAVISDSGLASTMSTILLPEQTTSALIPFATLLILGVILSEFGSNTASASILIPVVLASNMGPGTNTVLMLVIGVAFAASFGFMLPVSTPPNAIVFGTGKLKLTDMIRAGILFDLLGLLLIFLYIGLIIPHIL